MKTLNNKQYKEEWRKNHPELKGSTIKNFRQVITYPNSGTIRYHIKIDKNGQVYEVRQSFANIIRDSETKKRFIRITLGERPLLLFDKIKGRPFTMATDYIDSYISDLLTKSKE